MPLDEGRVTGAARLREGRGRRPGAPCGCSGPTPYGRPTPSSAAYGRPRAAPLRLPLPRAARSAGCRWRSSVAPAGTASPGPPQLLPRPPLPPSRPGPPASGASLCPPKYSCREETALPPRSPSSRKCPLPARKKNSQPTFHFWRASVGSFPFVSWVGVSYNCKS